jgi:methyl-accepting chemotaxis protein
MLSKFKIGPKLIGGFLVVALIAIVIGVFGISKLHQVNDADTYLYEKATLPLADLVEIAKVFEMQMREIRDLARTKDPQNKEVIIRNIETFRSKITKASEHYESTLVTEEGKKLFEQFQDARKNIASELTLIYDLSRANKETEVYALIDNQFEKNSSEEEEIIDKMISQKTETARKIEVTNTNSANSATIILTIIMIMGVVIAVIIGLMLTRSITTPLSQGVTTMGEMAKGNLLVNFDSKTLASGDETGILTRAMKDMTKQLKETISFTLEASENVSTGSIQLSSASQGISQGSSEQAASVEEISASLEQISSSIEEMTASINQNAENANQTEKIAMKSSIDAKDGGEAVQKTVTAMKLIAEKISIIQEIARQTNLLSLNASIEAARAGEHGKGFAVVASAVQKLAERSQDAAEEISKLSKSSVDVAVKAGEMLDKLVPDIGKTAELVGEINAASAEQNNGIQQVNTAVQQVNSAIQQFNTVVQSNASASEELASTSEELSSQAEELKNRISFFQVENSGTRNKTDGHKAKKNHSTIQKAHISQHPVVSTSLKDKQYTKPADNNSMEQKSGVAIDMKDEQDNNFQRI